MLPSQASARKITLVIAIIGNSKLVRFVFDFIDLAKIDVAPIISKIFAMFEPTALATTISGTPLNTATKEEISSGKEVPAPTITTPTTNGESPAAKPIFSALPKKMSAPFTKTKRLTTKIIIETINMKILYQIKNIPEASGIFFIIFIYTPKRLLIIALVYGPKYPVPDTSPKGLKILSLYFS